MSDYLNKSNLRSMLEDPGTPTLVILKQAANVLRAVQRDVFQGEDRKEAIELLHAAYDRVTATRGVSMVEAASGHSGKYFVYRLENEHEKAAREAVRATALWPASDVLRCNAGLESEANGELGDALHQYRMCDSRKPGQPEVRAAITRLEAEIGDFGK